MSRDAKQALEVIFIITLIVWLLIGTISTVAYMSRHYQSTIKCGDFTEYEYKNDRYPTRCTRESWRFEQVVDDYMEGQE